MENRRIPCERRGRLVKTARFTIVLVRPGPGYPVECLCCLELRNVGSHAGAAGLARAVPEEELLQSLVLGMQQRAAADLLLPDVTIIFKRDLPSPCGLSLVSWAQ